VTESRSPPATGTDRRLLQGKRLVRTYTQGANRVHALRDVDIDVARGEFVAVVGPSGSGKSTLLHVLGALERPTRGEVLLDGTSLPSLSDADLALTRRRRFGFVLQFFNLFPTLSAVENAAFPLLLDGEARALDRGRAMLERVELGHRGQHRPAELSGGEQQRVAIARALVTDPDVVFADEPTGNLDSAAGEGILSLLRRAADAGQTIFMVTHEPGITGFADRLLCLSDGSVVEEAGGPGG
jgi:putative ABC transport system ATP-binding protein